MSTSSLSSKYVPAVCDTICSDLWAHCSMSQSLGHSKIMSLVKISSLCTLPLSSFLWRIDVMYTSTVNIIGSVLS